MMSEVCNEPSFRSNCSWLDERNEKDSTDVVADKQDCTCQPHLCRNRGLRHQLVPGYRLIQSMALWEYEDYKKYLLPVDRFIGTCEYRFISTKKITENCYNAWDWKSIRCPTKMENYLMNVCYTINTLIGRPNAEPRKVNSAGEMKFDLLLHQHEYNRRFKALSSQISFHNPRAVLSPYLDGYNMETGKLYTYRLKKTIKILLPTPYKTDCMDYITLWKARGGHGPTSQKECILECQKNTSLSIRGCIEATFMSPGNERRCHHKNYSVDTLVKSFECEQRNCKAACYEETIEITRNVDHRETSQAPCSASREDGAPPDDLTAVQILFNGMETTTYRYRAKYEIVEMFSYLGGYMGIWLGFSLVAVFDLLETAVMMVNYPIRRYTNSKTRHDKIRKLTNMHRGYLNTP